MTPVDRARRGRWAEIAAMIWLGLKGWRVVARRHAGSRGTGIGEVDLVVARGRVLAFVEIKFRPTLEQAAHSISHRQQRRIVKAARAFIAHDRRWSDHTIRFDAVLIAPWRRPTHIVDAWPA